MHPEALGRPAAAMARAWACVRASEGVAPASCPCRSPPSLPPESGNPAGETSEDDEGEEKELELVMFDIEQALTVANELERLL